MSLLHDLVIIRLQIVSVLLVVLVGDPIPLSAKLFSTSRSEGRAGPGMLFRPDVVGEVVWEPLGHLLHPRCRGHHDKTILVISLLGKLETFHVVRQPVYPVSHGSLWLFDLHKACKLGHSNWGRCHWGQPDGWGQPESVATQERHFWRQNLNTTMNFVVVEDISLVCNLINLCS